jgi:hypothetical protein
MWRSRRCETAGSTRSSDTRSTALGRGESLFPVIVSDFHRTYEPSPDGQRFLVAVPATGGAAVTVVVNWLRSLEP